MWARRGLVMGWSHSSSCCRYREHTWYPGYTWSYAYCPQCGKLIGWQFFKEDSPMEGFCLAEDGICPDVFTALIIDAVLYKPGLHVPVESVA